jgi:hypothetical protein
MFTNSKSMSMPLCPKLHTSLKLSQVFTRSNFVKRQLRWGGCSERLILPFMPRTVLKGFRGLHARGIAPSGVVLKNTVGAIYFLTPLRQR